jgi:hypothetical protein
MFAFFDLTDSLSRQVRGSFFDLAMAYLSVRMKECHLQFGPLFSQFLPVAFFGFFHLRPDAR